MNDEQQHEASRPTVVGDGWADDITDVRKAELEKRLRDWNEHSDHGDRSGPFHGERLTGADVFWLAARALAGTGAFQGIEEQAEQLRREAGAEYRMSLDVPALHLEHADLAKANLAGANLSRAHLSGATMRWADLSGALLDVAHLAGADLGRTDLTDSLLAVADLSSAYLDGADLTKANLEGANLSGAVLDAANLTDAYVNGVNFSGTSLYGVNLDGADFRAVRMSSETNLSGARFSPTTLLADVAWNAAPLAQVHWETLPVVGDETQARKHQDEHGKYKDETKRLSEYEAAVRAYRLLAVALRAQGLNEYADRYGYRAQLCQQHVLRLQKRWGQWLFAGLLWALSGYGYRLGRILVTYGAALAAFTLVYAVLGVHSFQGEPGVRALWDSFLVSLSAIHGRTTFEQLGAWSPAAWAAAVESVVGIVIEGVFVAMLVQRFFAR